jgi:hypothetical protein
MKGLDLCPVDDNECKYHYCDSCYMDSSGSASDRKFSITIKINFDGCDSDDIDM